MITLKISQNTASYNTYQSITSVAASELRSRLLKQRRQRNLQRKYILLVATVFIILFVAFSFRSFISDAHEEDDIISFKYYTSIMVKYGESLWSIADAHMSPQYSNHNDYIWEVAQINHLKSNEIRAGQYLVIPYYSEEFID